MRSILIAVIAVLVMSPCLGLAAPVASSAAGSSGRIRALVPGDGQPVAPTSAAGKLLIRLRPTRISGLTILSVDRELVVRQSVAGDYEFFANMRGRFIIGDPAKRRLLLIQGQRVALSAKGDFIASFPISAEAQEFRMRMVDVLGHTEEESVVIEVPRWRQINANMKSAAKAGPETAIFIGLGYSSYRYQESGVGPFNEGSLAAKISFQRQFARESRFDLALNTFFTVAPLSTTEASGRTISFFGLNARIGYRTDLLPDPWRLTLMGGIYYLTTSTSDGTFGFQNLMGPQIFPAIRYRLSMTSALSAYAKYSPVGSGLTLEFANRELAAGLSYVKVFGTTPFALSFDFSNFAATIEGDAFRYNSYSLGLAIGF